MNITLAAIPVALAYLLAWAIEKWTIRQRTVPWTVWVLPVLVWLAFLPNTCYLLTEWRHLLLDQHFTEMREESADYGSAIITVGRQGLFFLVYSAIGALCFALAIRPMHHLLRKARLMVVAWAIPFFFLVSLGVYMGMIVRLNSWDLARRPGYVAQIAVHALTTPRIASTIVVFASLLWLLYIIVDMWVDGFKMRWKAVQGD